MTTDFAAAADLLLPTGPPPPGSPPCPTACGPPTRAEGYEAAAAVARLSGSDVAGWKIAATSEAGQRHINVDGPIIGRILKSRLLAPGASVALGDNIMRVAEAEFAFGFASDLPARAEPYSQDEAIGAVGSLHLSIEVPDSRYQDFTKVGAAQLIADTACASWLVLGPAVDRPWRHLDLSVPCREGTAQWRACGGRNRQGGAGRAAEGAHLVRQRGIGLLRGREGRAIRHHRHLHRALCGYAGRRSGGGLWRAWRHFLQDRVSPCGSSRPEPLTREAFRPFGDVIEMEGSGHFTINQGFAERFNDLAHVDVAAEGGSTNVSLFLCQPRPLPIEIRLMERHPLGSQIFFPLEDRPWLVLVAEDVHDSRKLPRLHRHRPAGRQLCAQRLAPPAAGPRCREPLHGGGPQGAGQQSRGSLAGG